MVVIGNDLQYFILQAIDEKLEGSLKIMVYIVFLCRCIQEAMLDNLVRQTKGFKLLLTNQNSLCVIQNVKCSKQPLSWEEQNLPM